MEQRTGSQGGTFVDVKRWERGLRLRRRCCGAKGKSGFYKSENINRWKG